MIEILPDFFWIIQLVQEEARSRCESLELSFLSENDQDYFQRALWRITHLWPWGDVWHELPYQQVLDPELILVGVVGHIHGGAARADSEV